MEPQTAATLSRHHPNSEDDQSIVNILKGVAKTALLQQRRATVHCLLFIKKRIIVFFSLSRHFNSFSSEDFALVD
jgi:hypothetical protein